MATGAIDKEFIIDITNVKEPTQWCLECCIYKVPKRLRAVKEKAYTPKLISIGPVHRHNEELNLEDMEMLKLKYFKEFFDRTSKVQKDFADIVEENKGKIRHCYEVGIKIPDDKAFKEMILLDSIFIIELFLRTATREEDEKDYILSKPWLEDGIKQDLILLENQLPFFILDELYRHFARSTTCITKCFLTLAWNYFFPDKRITIDLQKDVKHFTDLQRSFYCPPNLKTGKIIEHLYSATKLNEAGLKFKKWEKKKLEHTCYSAKKEEEEEHKCLLDLEIKKPCPGLNCSWLVHCLPCLNWAWLFPKRLPFLTSIVLPCFVVDDKTEGVFRNLMALEQCHYPFHAYICNYIVLLIYLINTKEDVELLVKNRIIVYALGSNTAVAELVRNLGREIVEKNSCFYELAEDLNMHVMNTTFLKTVYFRDIWRGTSSILGFLVTFATIGSFLTTFMIKK